MAAYPSLDTIKNISPTVKMNVIFKTLVSDLDGGSEQRKRKRIYPKRNFDLQYRWLDKSDARTLWQFYLDRYGAYEAFNFFLPYPDTYAKEYVGTGDGSTTVFNLPSKTAASYTLYIDDVQQTETTDYTFSAQGGADGADKLTLVAAASDGARITWSFTGYLKIHCRYTLDNLEFSVFFRLLTHMGMPFTGLLNA